MKANPIIALSLATFFSAQQAFACLHNIRIANPNLVSTRFIAEKVQLSGFSGARIQMSLKGTVDASKTPFKILILNPNSTVLSGNDLQNINADTEKAQENKRLLESEMNSLATSAVNQSERGAVRETSRTALQLGLQQ